MISYGKTDIGMVRAMNQDTIFFSDKSIQPDNIHTRKTLAFKYAVLNLMLAAIFAYICFAKTLKNSMKI